MNPYELIEMLSGVQRAVAGQEVPHKFNQMAVDKLSEKSKKVLEEALNDLGSEDVSPVVNPLQKMLALQVVMKVSAIAQDIKTFNDVCNKWLADDQYEAGVGKNGEIVLWEKARPESRITMAAPKESHNGLQA